MVLLFGCFTAYQAFSGQIKFQTIQFSLSIVFVNKELNVKTVLFQTIHFSISTQFKYQNSPISSNSVYISTQFSSI